MTRWDGVPVRGLQAAADCDDNRAEETDRQSVEVKLSPMAPRILTFVSTFLLVTGVAMLLFYAGSQLRASEAHRQGMETFQMAQQAQATVPASPPAMPASADSAQAVAGKTMAEPPPQSDRLANAVAAPDKSLWSPKRIADYEKYADKDPDMPAGIMSIPSVDLKLPIFDGTEESNLTRGAGIIEGTAPLQAAGNTGLAAHRDGYFRSLKDVAVGDRIIVETLSGVDDYRIDELLVVDPIDTYVLDPTDKKVLTLVTCYPFYFVGSAPQRFIVRATRL